VEWLLVKFRIASGSALIVAWSLSLTACSSYSVQMGWPPIQKKAAPAPEAVNELNLVNTDGTPASFPQYWKRNTLVIDLSGIGASGNVAARLPEETTWPVRVAVRVRPGSVGQIEIQGEERNVLPVATEGTQPIDIEFAPSVYTPRTAAIYISWGPSPVFVEAPPEPAQSTPEFVSPTELPKPHTEATPDGSASDIVAPAEVPPAEVPPAQPSPPPGS
jgi:hypothetical protein